jgi:hypothetical protein
MNGPDQERHVIVLLVGAEVPDVCQDLVDYVLEWKGLVAG